MIPTIPSFLALAKLTEPLWWETSTTTLSGSAMRCPPAVLLGKVYIASSTTLVWTAPPGAAAARSLRRGRGVMDAPGGWHVGAKGKSPFETPVCPWFELYDAGHRRARTRRHPLAAEHGLARQRQPGLRTRDV